MGYTIVRTTKELKEAIEACEKTNLVGVDTETSGLDPFSDRLLLVQLSNDTQNFILIVSSLVKEDKKISLLKPFLENKEGPVKVFHNTKFDYAFLKAALGIKTHNMADTGLTETLIMGGLDDNYYNDEERAKTYKLGELSEKYLGIELIKDVRDEFVGHDGINFTEAQLEYAALDSELTRKILIKQTEILREKELIAPFKLECSAIQACSELEYNGCLINTRGWEAATKYEEEELRMVETSLIEAVTPYLDQTKLFEAKPQLNFNSRDQLLAIMNKMGMKVENAQEQTLQKIDKPFVKDVLAYKEHSKSVSSFGKTILEKINKTTGRIHPSVNQIGAGATGRMSYSNPNLQQIKNNTTYHKLVGLKGYMDYPLDEPLEVIYNERDITLVKKAVHYDYTNSNLYIDTEDNVYVSYSYRDLFIAPPGKVLITADYSQMELRILAEFSQDETFVEAFNAGRDIHHETMVKVFKSEDKKNRNKAKTVNFGLVYGITEYGLSRRLKIPVEEGKEVIDGFFEAFPSIYNYLEDSSQKAWELGYSKTLSGRKRFFTKPDPETTDPDAFTKARQAIEREGKNAPIQGSNADVTKKALSLLQEWIDTIPGDMIKLILAVHDEIVIECDEKIKDEVSDKMRELMIKAGETWIKSVPVEVDINVSNRWEK